jgi:hypothetical protein
MTEEEWLACKDPRPLLKFLKDGGRLSDRKARLFAAACCRRVWRLLPPGPARRAVEVAELFADGLASIDDLSAPAAPEDAALRAVESAVWLDAFSACHYAALAVACDPGGMPLPAGVKRFPALRGTMAAEQALQCAILRDIFSPPPPLAPALLTWEGGLLPRLARAAYDNRTLPASTLDPVRLAVLADALEEAGCQDQGVLQHLREPGRVHVPGCFVVDPLLGLM